MSGYNIDNFENWQDKIKVNKRVRLDNCRGIYDVKNNGIFYDGDLQQNPKYYQGINSSKAYLYFGDFGQNWWSASQSWLPYSPIFPNQLPNPQSKWGRCSYAYSNPSGNIANFNWNKGLLKNGADVDRYKNAYLPMFLCVKHIKNVDVLVYADDLNLGKCTISIYEGIDGKQYVSDYPYTIRDTQYATLPKLISLNTKWLTLEDLEGAYKDYNVCIGFCVIYSGLPYWNYHNTKNDTVGTVENGFCRYNSIFSNYAYDGDGEQTNNYRYADLILPYYDSEHNVIYNLGGILTESKSVSVIPPLITNTSFNQVVFQTQTNTRVTSVFEKNGDDYEYKGKYASKQNFLYEYQSKALSLVENVIVPAGNLEGKYWNRHLTQYYFDLRNKDLNTNYDIFIYSARVSGQTTYYNTLPTVDYYIKWVEHLPFAILKNINTALTWGVRATNHTENNNNVQLNQWDESGKVTPTTQIPPTANMSEMPTNIKGNADENTYITKTELTEGLSTYGKMSRFYILNDLNLQALRDYLYSADDTKLDELIKGLKMQGDNPINALMSLRAYPFDVSQFTQSTNQVPLVIGRTNLQFNVIEFANQTRNRFSFSGVIVPRKYNNFFDFEPYTNIFLYVPFCGVHKLSGTYIGKAIDIELIVEFSTGTCCACVFADGIAIDYLNGKIGVDMAITGDNAGQFASGVTSSIINTVKSAGSTMQSLAKKDVANSVSNALSTAQGVLDITQSFGTDIQQSGVSSGNLETIKPQIPYLIIERTIPQTPSNYGHTRGYLLCEKRTLSECSGFTILSNVDLSGISLTDVEKNELKSILESGFYA